MHPVYPANCTDDLAFIEENNCTELLWPKVGALWYTPVSYTHLTLPTIYSV